MSRMPWGGAVSPDVEQPIIRSNADLRSTDITRNRYWRTQTRTVELTAGAGGPARAQLFPGGLLVDSILIQSVLANPSWVVIGDKDVNTSGADVTLGGLLQLSPGQSVQINANSEMERMLGARDWLDSSWYWVTVPTNGGAHRLLVSTFSLEG